MKTITYKLKDLDQKEKKVTLNLGYVGENEHVQIRIDCSEIWENYPNAVASLAVEPPEGEKYPAIVTREGNVVCWTVKDSDVVHDGDGRIQLTFTEGSEIQKTVICRTKVDESIIGSGTTPDPIADFVAEANEALAELEAAEVHGPVIGEDGYWYTWSKDAGEYVKTDTKAQGEDGQQGPAGKDGKDGADGAPGQDGHTPVKGTDYWTQQDQADIVAAAALETVSAVIDDAAGDGDTDKTWSADKIAETTGQLLTAIQGLDNDKYEKPSGGIPASDMTEEVQNTLSGVGKSENRDGIVQSTNTATKNITSGQYVIWNGSLYTASANIAIGETLSLSNLDPVSDGGFNALRDEIEKKHSIKAYKKYVQQEQSTGAVWIALDEPIDIENGDEIEILIYQSDKATSGRSWSNTASWNAMAIQNKNRNSIQLQDQHYLNSDRPAMQKIKKMDGYVIYQSFSNNTLAGFGVDFPDNFDSFLRIQIDPVSSTLKAGCTVEITVRKTI